jgi:hypothetical protein
LQYNNNIVLMPKTAPSGKKSLENLVSTCKCRSCPHHIFYLQRSQVVTTFRYKFHIRWEKWKDHHGHYSMCFLWAICHGQVTNIKKNSHLIIKMAYIFWSDHRRRKKSIHE